MFFVLVDEVISRAFISSKTPFHWRADDDPTLNAASVAL